MEPKVLLQVFILILALVFLLLAAMKVPEPERKPSWGWLGMFFWLLSVIVATIKF